MPMLDRAGTFHAYPTDIGVAETGPNNLATVTIAFSIFEEKTDGTFYDVASEGAELTGWFYVEKKDGSLNQMTLDALKSAFPAWDGSDLFWLQDTPLAEHPVQIVADFETYNGNEKLKVKWLNPFGSEGGNGGVTKTESTKQTGIRNRLSSKLRAVGTGASAPAPSSPAPKSPPKPPAESTAADGTLDGAWEAVTAKCNPSWDQAQTESEFWRIARELMPDADLDALTPAEFGILTREGPAKVTPF